MNKAAKPTCVALLVLSFLSIVFWTRIIYKDTQVYHDFESCYVHTELTIDSIAATKLKEDSVTIKSLVSQIDSIKLVVQHIDNQYQGNIDLMIGKTNYFLGFWTTIFTLALSIASLWQYFNFKEIKGKSEEWEKNHKKLLEEFKDKQRRMIHKLELEQEESREVTKCTMTMISLCNISNPSQIPTGQKDIVKHDMERLSTSIANIIQCLRDSDSSLTPQEITIMLQLLQISLCSTKQFYCDIFDNIRFEELIKATEMLKESFRQSHSIKQEDINSLYKIQLDIKDLVL
jgi:hypothetical protein